MNGFAIALGNVFRDIEWQLDRYYGTRCYACGVPVDSNAERIPVRVIANPPVKPPLHPHCKDCARVARG